MTPTHWRATAFNQSEDSSNRIHSDEMAKAYGFKGALVPGVTVASYLMHPALVAWGEDWLGSGHAHVVVSKPLYDTFSFDVAVENESPTAFQAILTDQEDVQCANGTFKLNQNPEAPNTIRGDNLLTDQHPLVNATRDEMERLRDKGMLALASTWSQKNHMYTYLKDPSQMPRLHNMAEGGFANGAYLLSLTNWVLAGNAMMNPWIHLQTTSQYYAPVANNTDLIAECHITDLFDRKGHEFVDLNVDVYVRESGEPVMKALLRAIYQLRPPA